MAFSRAAHSRLPKEHTATGRAPPAATEDGQAQGVSKAMQFIEEYEARKALVAASDHNARPTSRTNRRQRAHASRSPTRSVTRSRTVERPRVAGAQETSKRSRSRPRSSSAHRSKGETTATSAAASEAEPQAAMLPRASAAAYTSLAESRRHARELENEVERLRRQLKAESRGRMEDAARREEAEASRAGSMQATVAKLRVQLDASKRREEQAQDALNDLRKERGTVSDKETENSALRAQLADVRAQAEADRRAAKAAQSSLESRLRDVILKQSYRNSPDKHSEMTSAVDRRRVERDAETVVKHNRRHSLGQLTSAIGAANAAGADADEDESDRQTMGQKSSPSDSTEEQTNDSISTATTKSVDAEHQEDAINDRELARLAAERDNAQEQLASLTKVCKALESKVASQDKRIRQLGEATAAAEKNAHLQSKERELMAIQKERLTFQLQRYRKKERKNNVTRSESSGGALDSSTLTLFDGVSDKVRTLAEELAKRLVGMERQELEGYKTTVAEQQHTILKLNRKIAQLRVELGNKTAESVTPAAASPRRQRRSHRVKSSRSPLRSRSTGRETNAILEGNTAEPTSVQDQAQPDRNVSTEKVGEQANVLHEKSGARKDTVEDQVADEIDPELWASSVATALAFRAFQNGVEASRTESPQVHDQAETETETETEPDRGPEPEPEQPKPETMTPSPTLSPGDRLFKFAASCPATGDDVGSDPESDDSQPHWDIDVTSANSVSFLGATLREGRSPPRSSPVQMFDEGRLPRVGASALFRVATGSI